MFVSMVLFKLAFNVFKELIRLAFKLLSVLLITDVRLLILLFKFELMPVSCVLMVLRTSTTLVSCAVLRFLFMRIPDRSQLLLSSFFVVPNPDHTFRSLLSMWTFEMTLHLSRTSIHRCHCPGLCECRMAVRGYFGTSAEK